MTIFLCGFMGCGKSTIGAVLAETLHCPFIDMDAYIEEQANMNIPQIFASYGEPYFRDLETKAVQELAVHDGVIACGGGAMLRNCNAEIARAHGSIILLDVPFSVCYSRIAMTDRPIVRNHTLPELEALYHDRYSIYQAHCTHVISADCPPETAVSEILNILHLPEGELS